MHTAGGKTWVEDLAAPGTSNASAERQVTQKNREQGPKADEEDQGQQGEQGLGAIARTIQAVKVRA